jgi:transposase-like protein
MGSSDMSLAADVSRFNTEEKCRSYLEQLRWPDGVRCPRCDAGTGISRIETRGQFDCDACGYQFSVRVGTILQNSNLPLWKWFLAVYVMGRSKEGVSASQLKRMLDVSYKTAWYLCHRIRAAMKDEASEALRELADPGETHAPDALITQSEAQDHADAETDAIEPEWSNFVRSIGSSYHHLSAKHLPAYLDETAFRYKNRHNAYLFRDTLLRLIGSEPMSYSNLIAGH